MSSADDVLFGIVTTDRDSEHIEKFFNSNFKSFFEGRGKFGKRIDIMVVCREEDLKTIATWKRVFPEVIIGIVDNYTIDPKLRHNLKAIENKRNIIREFALANNFSNLFFVDSDIIFQGAKTINILLSSQSKDADVCLVPYSIKWCPQNKMYVGIFDGATSRFSLEEVKNTSDEEEVSFMRCAIGGMGCTLLKTQRAIRIPFAIGTIKNTIGTSEINFCGEDVGYFIQAHQQGLNVEYVCNHTIEHL